MTEKIKVQPNTYLMIDTCRASGGISYVRDYGEERVINDGDGIEQEFTTRKIVDNVEVVEKMQKLLDKTRYVIGKKSCASTPLGYVADATTRDAVLAEWATLRQEADALNRQAALCRCSRRLTLGVVPVRLEIDNEAAAVEISRTVGDLLGDLYHALNGAESAADPVAVAKEASKILQRGRNLEALATGYLREAVKDSLANAKSAIAELKKAAKEERAPELDQSAIDFIWDTAGNFGVDLGAGGALADVDLASLGL